MIPEEQPASRRRLIRRELLNRYLGLQQDLVDADPSTSAYQATIHAFRQMGYMLISSGFEDDLDRLLRIRVLAGGRPERRSRSERDGSPELLIMERRLL